MNWFWIQDRPFESIDRMILGPWCRQTELIQQLQIQKK